MSALGYGENTMSPGQDRTGQGQGAGGWVSQETLMIIIEQGAGTPIETATGQYSHGHSSSAVLEDIIG